MYHQLLSCDKGWIRTKALESIDSYIKHILRNFHGTRMTLGKEDTKMNDIIPSFKKVLSGRETLRVEE